METDEGHAFQPLFMNDAVTAACSCGWTSMYSHAYEKYAKDDHVFHVECQDDG